MQGRRIGWVFLWGMLAAGVVHAEAKARCEALWVSGRALVTVELEQLLDPELLRLIRLGLEGRIRIHLALVRTHPLWFDDSLVEADAQTLVTWIPGEQHFVLDGTKVLSATDTLETERISLRPEDPRDPEGHYRVDVRAEFQVVTEQSLAQVASWMGGAPKQRPAIPERVLQTLARDLTRVADGRCEVGERRAADGRDQGARGR